MASAHPRASRGHDMPCTAGASSEDFRACASAQAVSVHRASWVRHGLIRLLTRSGGVFPSPPIPKRPITLVPRRPTRRSRRMFILKASRYRHAVTEHETTSPDETRKERVDRELIELLNELRVALPGIQVLFAF
ncbi:MAG: DUF6328 family protein, partial [Actinomycetota bacterium]